MKKGIQLLGAGMLLLAGTSCETLNQISEVGTAVAMSSGVITEEQAGSINRSVVAVGKTFDDITPMQEYYIGRSVAASLLSQYKPYSDPVLTHYVNVLGQTLSRFSEKPETYGGYHFLVLDTDEINAFAAPGGLILVSRGLLQCCSSEDELAAVLAHEIGHVQHEDGLRAISSSRLTSALTILAMEGAKNLGGSQLAEVTKAFEGSISDVTQTLAVNGYSRRQEAQADAAAVEILQQTGYDPQALVGMLRQMQARMAGQPHAGGFASTHPAPASRIADVQEVIGVQAEVSPPAERQIRFERATAALRK